MNAIGLNQLQHDFTASGPNLPLAGDITCVRTRREVEITRSESINDFDKPRRIHATLGRKPRVVFEPRAA